MNDLMRKIKKSLSLQIEQRFYEVGLGYQEYVFGLQYQLLREIEKKQYCSFIPSATLQNITLERLGKVAKRYELNLIARYRLPRKLTYRQKMHLKTQRIKDIYSARVVSKTIIEISIRYILAPKGSSTRYYGVGAIFRKETGWQFDKKTYLPIVKNKSDLIKKRIDDLLSLIGKKAYKHLKENKATLKVWRRSQPFNWHIESNRGKILWHSENGRRPDIKLFEKIMDSERHISVPEFFFKIPGNGDPELSEYKLSHLYLPI